MAKKIQIQKTVFDRSNFKSTVNTKFEFYREPDPVIDPDNVGELFRLYDKLYMEIPIDGDNQSHEYLVKRSSELYQVQRQLEDIQPLLDEVAQLRTQILAANSRVIELEMELANGSELSFEDAEKVANLQADLASSRNTIAALEQANTLANAAAESANEAAMEANKKAQENAEEQAKNASKSTDNGVNNEEVEEIKRAIRNKNDIIGRSFRFIQKRWARIILGTAWKNSYNNRVSWARKYKSDFYWLYGKDPNDKAYPSRRGGNYGGTYLIPSSRNEADDMTLDFFVNELEQAGYKAGSIVEAVKQAGNIGNRVKFRVITYKDPEKEDKVGYRLVK